jgi:hypothetical protein
MQLLFYATILIKNNMLIISSLINISDLNLEVKQTFD